MTIDELVASVEAEKTANRQRQDDLTAEVEAILATAKRENRPALTQAESARSDALFKDIDAARAAGRRIDERLSRARQVAVEEAETDRRSRITRDSGARLPAYDGVMRIGQEARTYNPGTDPAGTGFVADVCKAMVHGQPEAWSRLSRHMQEERVERPQYQERVAGDLNSAGAGGIVVPQYLVDLTAPAVAARRPFADHCTTKHILPPEGMTLTVPVISTATSAALQASQLGSVSATSMAETDLTINVQTASGMQNVSRQAADRSRIDEFVLADLFSRYAAVVDSTMITQATPQDVVSQPMLVAVKPATSRTKWASRNRSSTSASTCVPLTLIASFTGRPSLR